MAEAELRVKLTCRPRWWVSPALRAVAHAAPILGVDRAERLGAWFAERGFKCEVLR